LILSFNVRSNDTVSVRKTAGTTPLLPCPHLRVTRDLLVDRRVHKVYLYALPLLIVGPRLAVYMWRSNPSWWQRITHAIL
jgi:hypothetical protein